MSGCDTSYVEMRTTVSTKGNNRRVRTVLIDVGSQVPNWSLRIVRCTTR